MGRILLNLCMALLLLNIFFIIASRASQFGHDGACAATTALTHYFLLASFLWLLLDAVNFYQRQVTVFISFESHFLLRRSLMAWGKSAFEWSNVKYRPKLDATRSLRSANLDAQFGMERIVQKVCD